MLLILGFLACSVDYSNGDSTAGATVYADNCESCHGTDGALGVLVGGEPAADLTFETSDQTDDELADVILHGAGTMPAQDLTNTETADCIAYMRQTFTGTDTGGDTGDTADTGTVGG